MTLELPKDDYVIFGSAPLLLWGIRQDVRDLDIVARGEAWDRARALGKTLPTPSGHGRMVILFEGKIEIFDEWISPTWDSNDLIDEADIVNGVRFANFRALSNWKRTSTRQKDKEDARLLLCYTKRWSRPASG